MKTSPLLRASCTAVLLIATASETLAADGFKLRFPLSGTLGGEIVAPLPTEGWFGSVVVTDVNVSALTGDDGNPKQMSMQVPVPALTTVQATALTAALGVSPIREGVKTILTNGTANVVGSASIAIAKYHQTIASIALGHVLTKDVNGGKLVALVNIPYAAAFDTSINVSGTLAAGAGTPTEVAANTIAKNVAATGYNTNLAKLGSDASINTSGIGDIEASLLWEKTIDDFKVVAGASFAMPTGNYKYVKDSLTPNIGFGNFYTLRTGLGVAYAASESVTLGARGSLGFNSQNADNYVRSGDFYAIDLAAAFRTPVGVIGPHVTMLQQYTDDTGGTAGANRVSVTGAGFFYTVPIVSWGAGLNVAYMKTTETKNSLSGDFVQFRLSKVF